MGFFIGDCILGGHVFENPGKSGVPDCNSLSSQGSLIATHFLDALNPKPIVLQTSAEFKCGRQRSWLLAAHGVLDAFAWIGAWFQDLGRICTGMRKLPYKAVGT